LQHLLENDDGEAADFMIEVRPIISGAVTKTEIDNLSELVGDFNFEAAVDCLSSIIARLKQKVGANNLKA
jgi:hypothetical protein